MEVVKPYHGETILVTGATGRQGGAVCRKLLKDGWTVKALTRYTHSARAKELEALGAEVVEGDMEDLDGLKKVLQGVRSVFGMQTFWEGGVEAEIRQGKNLAQAAHEAKVKHFVYSSALYTDHYTGVPHWDSKIEIESHIHSFRLPLTIIRSASFMENFLREDMQKLILTGKVCLPLRSLCIRQYLALDDLATVVEKVFSSPEQYIGEELFLAGDQLNMSELTGVFSKILGRELKYVSMPKLVSRFKMGKEYNKMFRWLDKRKIDDMSGANIESLRVNYPFLMRFEDWLIKQKQSNLDLDALSIANQ